MWRSPSSTREGDHAGQLTRERRLDLATILAQRRLDVRQTELAVDVLFRLGGDQVARHGVEQPVLIQLQARADGHLPGIRTLCAFEPVK